MISSASFSAEANTGTKAVTSRQDCCQVSPSWSVTSYIQTRIGLLISVSFHGCDSILFTTRLKLGDSYHSVTEFVRQGQWWVDLLQLGIFG